jgi:hypothetical protein
MTKFGQVTDHPENSGVAARTGKWFRYQPIDPHLVLDDFCAHELNNSGSNAARSAVRAGGL